MGVDRRGSPGSSGPGTRSDPSGACAIQVQPLEYPSDSEVLNPKTDPGFQAPPLPRAIGMSAECAPAYRRQGETFHCAKAGRPARSPHSVSSSLHDNCCLVALSSQSEGKSGLRHHPIPCRASSLSNGKGMAASETEAFRWTIHQWMAAGAEVITLPRSPHVGPIRLQVGGVGVALGRPTPSDGVMQGSAHCGFHSDPAKTGRVSGQSACHRMRSVNNDPDRSCQCAMPLTAKDLRSRRSPQSLTPGHSPQRGT